MHHVLALRAMLTSVSMASLFVLSGACAGELKNPDSYFSIDGGADAICPSGIDVPADILASASCSNLGCHSADTPNIAPDLASPNVEERLINIPTSGCDDRLLIDPNDPMASYLLESLSPSPACGNQMPIGGSLTPEELACVKQWIENL